ncbi:brain protein I3 [Triplophysa rosa]|uniref:Membrane protein BRI3 n=1 Tax=Triplophysa rosa TaxID=992332 RepID=A0A9W7TTX4_TRIRA|nr:brain protein I3 [Triplophysa rosa]KAI7803457.1 brain protein I3 [Triplophysa rosa]
MDNKPLLQARPPAYNAVPGAYAYGAIPAAAPPAAGFQPPAPPPPYQGFPGAAAGFPAAPGQPAAGYPAAPGQPAAVAAQTAYTSTYTIVQPSVVVVGGCPACRVGVLEDDFTCLGIMCAIFFFPLGILFCLALRQRRCPNCGATFG